MSCMITPVIRNLKYGWLIFLPQSEKGTPTIPGKSKSEAKDKEKKHKKHKDRDKEKDKEHKKHKHRHKDRSKDKDREKKKDKSGHHDSDSKKHHEKVGTSLPSILVAFTKLNKDKQEFGVGISNFL